MRVDSTITVTIVLDLHETNDLRVAIQHYLALRAGVMAERNGQLALPGSRETLTALSELLESDVHH